MVAYERGRVTRGGAPVYSGVPAVAQGRVELLRRPTARRLCPGLSLPRMMENGWLKLIPAGSKIVFQMHYTPNGKPQEDISTLGLKF